MDDLQFDRLAKRLSTTRLSRLTALRGLAASAAALTGVGLLGAEVGAKGGHGHGHGHNKNEKKIRICVCQGSDAATCKGQKKEKKKAKKALKNNPCAYKGRCNGTSGCAAATPLTPLTPVTPVTPVTPPLTVAAPFTISACWTADQDHDTYLRVPSAETGAFIDYTCNPDDSDCEEDVFPFACVSDDQTDAGCEDTTIRRLVAGTYQYWIEIDTESAAGEVTVTLRNSSGGTLATFTGSPANPSEDDQIGWHVFDVDGSTGVVTTINQTVNEELPEAFPGGGTDVCNN